MMKSNKTNCYLTVATTNLGFQKLYLLDEKSRSTSPLFCNTFLSQRLLQHPLKHGKVVSNTFVPNVALGLKMKI